MELKSALGGIEIYVHLLYFQIFLKLKSALGGIEIKYVIQKY